MRYDFRSQERDFGRVVFALTLNRKRMTERVIIGRADDVRQRLESKTGGVYYDETRPLGSLLLTFESDKTGEWTRNGAVLRDSYKMIFPMEAERWRMAAPVSDFLRRKCDSGEPSAMFAAIRTWEDYLNCFGMNHGADVLNDRLAMLYKPFHIYADSKPWRKEAEAALTNAWRDGESQVELWYPVAKRSLETVVTASSFLPLIFYYLHKVREWQLVFQKCKVCGKNFLARSRHFELCSDECRKQQAVTAKREFDERAKGDRLEQLDEAAYYYWYNRLRKLRKGKAANPNVTTAFKVAFDEYRKEAVRRKGAVKREEMTLAEFAGWLSEQQDVADRLMDEYTRTVDSPE
jgi:hypothetical protein